MKTRLIILISAVIMMSCSRDESHWIIGNWEWVKTSGGFGGVTYTPQSTGRHEILKISMDTFCYYVNGELKDQIDYKIIMSESGTRLIQQGERQILQSFILTDDILILRDPCCDLFEYTYRRLD
jgi:hypothetical protein